MTTAVTDTAAAGDTAATAGEPRGVLLADVTTPADVHGVHGAAGLSHWKCLAGRHDLTGEWEAVEWASIPPGGVSGEHRHTRTEELYFLLSGEGEMYLDGTPHAVSAGSLILTGLGTVHGLVNTGTTRLDWLVAEIRSPHTSGALRGRTTNPSGDAPRRRTEEEADVNARIHRLDDEQRIDPTTFLTGPLRLIETVTVAAGESLDLAATGTEHTVFVLSGSGTAVSGDSEAPLGPGVSVTLPRGTSARIRADHSGTADGAPDGLRLFHAELSLTTAAVEDE
ncbi:cupin domain-containing protein [Streptomyces sp. NPDC098101]|uniref:cupin domain-containing protein n=1 Tax=Streptomyces sp. NPDC098101 TaxID=3366096 RepID=UPI003826B343